MIKAVWGGQEHWQKMKEASGETFQGRWHLDRVGREWESPVFMVADGEPRHGDAVIMTSVP